MECKLESGEWPPDEGDEHFAVVEDVQLEHTSDDVFGALTGGHLRLRGTLQQVQLLADFPEANGLSAAEVDEVMETPLIKYSAVINGKQADGKVIMDRNPYKTYEEENRDGVLFCMCILVYKFGTFGYLWVFLVLEVVSAADGRFRRVGVIELIDFEAVVALSRHEEEARFPCVEYRDRKHSILII